MLKRSFNVSTIVAALFGIEAFGLLAMPSSAMFLVGIYLVSSSAGEVFDLETAQLAWSRPRRPDPF